MINLHLLGFLVFAYHVSSLSSPHNFLILPLPTVSQEFSVDCVDVFIDFIYLSR
jgi:hypothetical protein